MANDKIGSLEELGNKLQKILIELLKDQDLCKLIYYSEDNPLAQPDIDPYSLLKTKVFTHLYQPPTDEPVVYVCVYYNQILQDGSAYWKNPKIRVSIITHRDLWDIDNGIRPFIIADKIDKFLNRNGITESLSNDTFEKFRYYPVNTLYETIEMNYSSWC